MNSALTTVLNLIAKEIGLPSNKVNTFNAQTRLKEDIGLDSLDMAQILICLEPLYPKMNVDVFFEEFKDEELTVNDLVIFIEKNS